MNNVAQTLAPLHADQGTRGHFEINVGLFGARTAATWAKANGVPLWLCLAWLRKVG
jgi:hypothetical protein